MIHEFGYEYDAVLEEELWMHSSGQTAKETWGGELFALDLVVMP